MGEAEREGSACALHPSVHLLMHRGRVITATAAGEEHLGRSRNAGYPTGGAWKSGSGVCNPRHKNRGSPTSALLRSCNVSIGAPMG